MDSTTRSTSRYAPTECLGGWRTLFYGCAALLACNGLLWIWDYNFAFTAGLNSASHSFTLYYRTLFWCELLANGAFAGLWYGWLIRTGRPMFGTTRSYPEELRRIAVLWGIIGAAR